MTMTRTAVIFAGALLWPALSVAETPNLPQAALDGMTQGFSQFVLGDVPQWETIEPRPIKDCLAESGGVINEAVMRCRNGRQEYVKKNHRGERQVMQERRIPK